VILLCRHSSLRDGLIERGLACSSAASFSFN